MNKFFKDTIEFYITNVCNFNCDNCNRLNNYYFSGHQDWRDLELVYQRWSERIDFANITVLGGEPLLNPSLDQWIVGLRKFWPQAIIRILTNGSRLSYWHKRGFFELLGNNSIELYIDLHNRSRLRDSCQEVKSYLKNPVVKIVPRPGINWADTYRQVKDPSWPDCDNYQDFEKLPAWIQDECRNVHNIDYDQWLQNTGMYTITDSLDPKIKITIDFSENFVTAPLRYAGQNRFAVYDSDPDAAHRVCLSKYCTHMVKGKMYKCHHMALLPEFSTQFKVDISAKDQHLLDSYQPLEATDDDDLMQEFLQNHVRNVIPQCKLCPSKLENIFLQSGPDKPKVKKIIPINPFSVV